MNKKLLGFITLGIAVFTATGWAADSPVQTLYNQKCSSCHGKDGKGAVSMAKMFKLDIAALDLTDKATLDKKDEELDKITAKGEGKMPAYEAKLKPEEIESLTTYFRSLAKPKS